MIGPVLAALQDGQRVHACPRSELSISSLTIALAILKAMCRNQAAAEAEIQ